jgi:hypothetical protein
VNWKKVVVVVALVVALLAVSGCCKGHIQASNVQELVHRICERHDRFVKGEPSAEDKDPVKKASHLRSSEILQAIVDDAAKKE